MRYVIALIVMIIIVPAQAGEEQLVGTWKGPHTFELRVRNVWIEGEGEGSWRSDDTTLFLQIHMPPMYSYRPPPIPCQFVLSGDRLTLGGCAYAGEYTRRQN
jgi:hypothetical protein